MANIEKRISDLEAGIKEKRIGDDKIKFIDVIGDGWVEVWNVETHEIKRVYNHDEQDNQTA